MLKNFEEQQEEIASVKKWLWSDVAFGVTNKEHFPNYERWYASTTPTNRGTGFGTASVGLKLMLDVIMLPQEAGAVVGKKVKRFTGTLMDVWP